MTRTVADLLDNYKAAQLHLHRSRARDSRVMTAFWGRQVRRHERAIANGVERAGGLE